MAMTGNRLEKGGAMEETTTYTYDDNGRLLSETQADVQIVYTYDNNGNVLSRVEGIDGTVCSSDQ